MARDVKRSFILNLLLMCLAVAFIELVLFNMPFWFSLLTEASETACSKLNISLFRIFASSIVVASLHIFRPASPLWTTELRNITPNMKAELFAILIVLMVSVAVFSQLSGQAKWLEQGAVYNTGIEAIQDGNQYNHLADALISGSVKLDLPVSDILLNMDNPYDPAERALLNSEKHEPIYWDYAYYDGGYYCYFGVIPCLLTFLPFKLITGIDLRTDIATVIFAYFVITSSLFFLKKAQEAWFPKLSVGSFLTGAFCLIMSCGILEQVFLPRIYPIPMLSALGFTLLGLGLWLSARTQYRNEGTWHLGQLILGSFCIALTLGCRPQFILSCLLAFPIFCNEICDRQFFSKDSVVRTLSMIIPFLIVAVPISCYNYVRFDSFTNFGAAYNLTGGDMTSYKFIPKKIAIQVLEYLFLPFQTISSFPFISTINDSPLAAAHPSLLTAEPFYAGFIFLTPTVLIIALLVFRKNRKLLSNDMLYLIMSCLSLSIVVIVIASYVSGTNMRYFVDFGWLLLIPAVLVFWAMSSRQDCPSRALTALPYLEVLSVTMYCWTFLGTARFGALIYECPTIWNAAAAVFAA